MWETISKSRSITYFIPFYYHYLNELYSLRPLYCSVKEERRKNMNLQIESFAVSMDSREYAYTIVVNRYVKSAMTAKGYCMDRWSDALQ